MVASSRFNMWRAVVALAHADGRIDPKEKDFVDRYLANVQFSENQKITLKDDLRTPLNVKDMFDTIGDRADQAEFFEFARMLVWCDGDLDAQEDRLFEYVKDSQMAKLDPEKMRALVRETRESAQIQRLVEDEEFQEDARKRVGFGAIVARSFGKRKKSA